MKYYNLWNIRNEEWTFAKHPTLGFGAKLTYEQTAEWLKSGKNLSEYPYSYEIREVLVVCKEDCCKK